MENQAIPPNGGRRRQRPDKVLPCTACEDPLGARYSTCPTCHSAIEGIWLADWQALLQQEQVTPGSVEEQLLAQVVLSEFGKHPWTVMDIAMSLVRCPECNHELGEMFPDCGTCSLAFGASIQSEFGATPNEHALHIGRWILRFPQRNSRNIVTAWSLSMPRLLTGWLPTTAEAQRTMRLIKSGRMDEVEQGIRRLDDRINNQGDTDTR